MLDTPNYMSNDHAFAYRTHSRTEAGLTTVTLDLSSTSSKPHLIASKRTRKTIRLRISVEKAAVPL